MKDSLKALVLWASLSFAQDCTVNLVDPAPSGVVCEQPGRLLVTKPGVRQFPTTSFTQCRDLCLNDLNCKSFSFQTSNNSCRILGTATTTEQVQAKPSGKFTFSNRSCYQRSGVCHILNPGFEDAVSDAGYRPDGSKLGQQDARIRPWSVLYGPTASRSRAQQVLFSPGDHDLGVTVAGAESIGVYQRVLWETDPSDPVCGMLVDFDSYDGPYGTDSDKGYTFTISYRNVVLKTATLHPYQHYFTVNNLPDHHVYGYRSQVTVPCGPEFLNALDTDPDRSQERIFGVFIKGPAGTDSATTAQFRVNYLSDHDE